MGYIDIAMFDLYTYMYEWNELYEQLEALVHVQVNIDVNFIFLIIKKKTFPIILGTQNDRNS